MQGSTWGEKGAIFTGKNKPMTTRRKKMKDTKEIFEEIEEIDRQYAEYEHKLSIWMMVIFIALIASMVGLFFVAILS